MNNAEDGEHDGVILAEISIIHPVALQTASKCQPPTPHKHSSSSAPEGLWKPATPWRSAASQAMGGIVMASRGSPESLQRLASFEPTVLSPYPPLYLLSFHFTGSGLQQPNSCLHTASSSGTELAGSLVPLGGQWRQASLVLCLLIATRGPLEGR